MYPARTLASLSTVTLLFATLIPVGSITLQQGAFASIGGRQRYNEDTQQSRFGPEDGGALTIIDSTGKSLGKCPLRNTAIDAKVSGFVSRVRVEQTFANPYSDTIEAVYTFPLSHTGAVDQMHMKIGERSIRGIIKTKEVAHQIYQNARSQGQIASLLDQERPNIFTQSVANIPPGATVKIEIHYVEYLPYENGNYTLAIPMVVGPRYIPDRKAERSPYGWWHEVDRTRNASKITPPMVREEKRAGHDVSLHVSVDAGVPIQNIQSKLHRVDIDKQGGEIAEVRLVSEDSIPNKDFVLNWKVAAEKIRTGYLTHRTDDTGYFGVMLLPPAVPANSQICPRELNFIIDRSGSQHGLPLQKCRETVLYALDRLNQNDTFQILSFSTRPEELFDKPMPATPENIATAKKYVASLQADGGTEMMEAVKAATRTEAPDHRLRMFILMSDGYVGDDENIIALVKKTRGVSRWFTFGTGDSVNRFIIDGIARAGGGESEYVLLNSSGDDVAKRFFEKIATPVLSDIKINFHGVDVVDVQPKTVNDLWGHRPIYITGKYLTSGAGTMTVKGYAGGKPYSETLPLTFPARDNCNAILPSVWARAKVDEIMPFLYEAQQFRYRSNSSEVLEAKKTVEQLGLKYHLLTDYTSFVAVDDSPRRYETATRTIQVPVETPHGVSLTKINGHTTSNSERHIQSPDISSVHIQNLGNSTGRNLRLPEEIGRIEGPRDMNMFQVEPTVLDERFYTTGRSERHQKTSPTLPEGAPIPDTVTREWPNNGALSGAGVGTGLGLGSISGVGTGGGVGLASNLRRKSRGAAATSVVNPRGGTPNILACPIGLGIGAIATGKTQITKPSTTSTQRDLMIKPNQSNGTQNPTPESYMVQNSGHSVYNKVAAPVQTKLKTLKNNQLLKVKLHVSTCDQEFINRLKELKSLKIISVDREKNEIIVSGNRNSFGLLLLTIKEVLLVTLAN